MTEKKNNNDKVERLKKQILDIISCEQKPFWRMIFEIKQICEKKPK